MKRYYIFLILLLCSGVLSAQTVDDALRFSKHNYAGTARSTAMGGAFGALGGDFSSLSINPAGIAVYRSSEFTITPSIEFNKAKNTDYTKDKYSFTMGNVGYVASFVPRLSPKSGWQNFNFGIGYNRVANFNREGMLFNLNSGISLIDRWAGLANGIPPSELYQFEEKLAYDVYLINADDENNYQSVLFDGDRMDQQKLIEEKGHIGEYVISFGANYSHKLYIGGTIGIQDVYYKSTTSYKETSIAGNQTSLEDFYFKEYLKTSGVGFNFKFGMIYRPFNNLRLGASIHTPTYYDLDEDYDTFVDAQFDPNKSGNADFPSDGNAYHGFESERIARNNYKLQSPMRVVLSGAYLIGKKAIVSVDYEHLDYSDSEFSDGNYENINTEITSSYQSTSNLRIGAELRLTPNFSLRGGFASIGDPYKGQIDESYNIYSGGFGIKEKNFFFDLAYQYKDFDEDFVLYPGSNIVTLNNKNQQLRMTFGFKF